MVIMTHLTDLLPSIRQIELLGQLNLHHPLIRWYVFKRLNPDLKLGPLIHLLSSLLKTSPVLKHPEVVRQGNTLPHPESALLMSILSFQLDSRVIKGRCIDVVVIIPLSMNFLGPSGGGGVLHLHLKDKLSLINVVMIRAESLHIEKLYQCHCPTMKALIGRNSTIHLVCDVVEVRDHKTEFHLTILYVTEIVWDVEPYIPWLLTEV